MHLRGAHEQPPPAAPTTTAHGTVPSLTCVCDSVPHIAVPVPYHPQEVKAERQQGRAQQVPQGCQVGDGEAVGVFAAPPHGMDHPVCYAQQQQDLRRKHRRGQEHRSATLKNTSRPSPLD